jgi:hypothetical protein
MGANMVVDPLVLDVLRQAARERRLTAADYRLASAEHHLKIHSEVAAMLENEASAIEHACKVLEALILQ